MTTRRLRQPTGETVDLLTTGVESGGAIFSLEGTLPPRCAGPPAHRHRRQSESFTVLDGILRVRMGRRRFDLGVGETVLVPPGVTHGFANPTGEITRFRCDETPADQLEHQLRALAASGRGAPIGALAALNVEWGLTFELAGLPGRVQRPLWRTVAALRPRRPR